MANDILEARVKRYPPQSQREACALAARQSIASVGPCEQRYVRSVASGIAQGLFGEAFDAAPPEQQEEWVNLCEAEYRKVLGNA